MQRQKLINQFNKAVKKLLQLAIAHASTHQRSQHKHWDQPSTFLHADTFEAVSYGTVWAGKISHLCILPYAHSEAVIRQSEVMLVLVAYTCAPMLPESPQTCPSSQTIWSCHPWCLYTLICRRCDSHLEMPLVLCCCQIWTALGMPSTYFCLHLPKVNGI